ncbi:T9SS type A sorting domain-containing protein [Saccharicrinis aurantiacus]|uniref:T9SS type A sorting domain-containing protein n=1 Tax=Saccharicrinis aurantiacus TaxID=1849719 RepID=UPI00094FE47B|nr:T9SS type A sorting domain-containing protein [Saccharicrinis aurantiacus]
MIKLLTNRTLYFYLLLSINFFSSFNVKSQETANGFKGLWYALGQYGPYGDKYSGGLGTYTAKHIPLAIYSEVADRTFFTYAGTTAESESNLLIMISYFDHKTGLLAKPTVVHNKLGITDAHDNSTIQIDSDGFIWVFISGRYSYRNGYIYRSDMPYNISNFTKIDESSFNYPQPKFIKDKGFALLLTNYIGGRKLFIRTSNDGYTWSADTKLVDFDGHYQISANTDDKIGFFYNWHKNKNVDNRTNLYYMESYDMGKTWVDINNNPLTIPLSSVSNSSLVKDYNALGLNVYLKDIRYNEEGYPMILYITSPIHISGPSNPDRKWLITQWNGTDWVHSEITKAYHNYDMGSLYIEDDGSYRIVAPTEVGPQEWGTGGEMAIWESFDKGITWTKFFDITNSSARNHTYARRPFFTDPDFYAFWADGNTKAFSKSCLYYTNKFGDVYQMPYESEDNFQTPIPIEDIEESYPQIYSESNSELNSPSLKILDNDKVNSGWKAIYFPQNVIIDYGEQKYFNTSQLIPYENRSYNYTVELSTTPDFSDSNFTVDRRSNSDNLNIDHFNTTLGRYAKLTITGQNQLTDRAIKISEFILEENNSTKSADESESFVSIFPNPVYQDFFTIKGIKPDSNITIYTANGTKIFSTKSNANSMRINCSDYKAGVYLVEITVNLQSHTQKVIIQK